MGQYYKPICLSEDYKQKPENCIVAAISSYDYDNGAKLTEHSYVGNDFVLAALNMLNQHNGSRFVWCGDYQEDFEPKLLDEDGDEMSLYSMADDFAKKTENMPTPIDLGITYIVNLDKKEYYKIPPYCSQKYTYHPLPLLCAAGNGLGGGDYHGKNTKEVGRWAFDHIEVLTEKPIGAKYKGFKSITNIKFRDLRFDEEEEDE